MRVSGLRYINIELGRAAADVVTGQVSERVRSCLRASDLLLQLGGDEYALILPGLRSPAQPRMAVNKILQRFEDPVLVDGHELRVRLVFGITVAPEDAT